jgi:hypothetical protein
MSKPPRPPIPDIPLNQPKPDNRFDAAAKLETNESVKAGIASGTIKTVNPATSPGTIRDSEREQDHSLGLKVPGYVIIALKTLSAQKRVTMRELMLRALSEKYGIEIDEADMIDARRTRR